MTKVLRFQTADENINLKIFEYNNSCLIEDMLKDFLKKTNSKDTLDVTDISFMFSGKILNKGDNLKKTVGQVFKRSNIPIQVTDTKDVIGGK